MTSINLLNLAKIGQLDLVPLSMDLVKRMLATAKQRLSKPGHHLTAVQCLAHTLDVDAATVRVLDGLRKQRNLSDDDGEWVTEAALQECLSQARAILIRVESVLRSHPALGG